MYALYGTGYQKENDSVIDSYKTPEQISFSTSSSTAFRCLRTGELVIISNTMPFLRNVLLYDLFARNWDYEQNVDNPKNLAD